MIRHGLFLLALCLTLIAGARDRFDHWVDATQLPPVVQETSVQVLDRDGALLRAYTVGDGRWRLNTTVDQVDPRYLAMLVAYEDGRFYHHRGVDGLAMTRAAVQALWHWRIVSGGSTLTMQVARLLENSGTGAWQGKLRQMRVAWALERRLTKDQILGLYLTRAPFGGNIEGVSAAARLWFGEPPRRITPAEAAFLVALPQSPEQRRPDRAPDVALAARNRVIARLSGAGLLTPEETTTAMAMPVPQRRYAQPMLAPHLADRALAEAPATQTHHLTIDAGLQAKLQRLATEALRGQGRGVSIAIMVADHRSGAVLGAVGSGGAQDGDDARAAYVDMTRALRSPGSTLKPLIYGIAFDQGIAHPETLINDRPVQFGSYAPQNFDGVFRGPVSARDALQLSLNIPAVALTEAFGPANLMAHLRRAGADPVLPGGQAGLAVALGGIGLRLEDLMRVYGGLARLGDPMPLHWRRGDLPAPKGRLMRASAAWQVGDVLAGLAPPAGAPRATLAYKTGTSYGHRDAWAIGYDGAYVVGVWMGRPDGTSVPGAFGGGLAAPVMFQAYQRIGARPTPLPPPPADTLLVGGADLPPPLRQFVPRGAVLPDADAPKLVFPPDGARLAGLPAGLVAKLRDGTPPFTWLANGRPVLARDPARSVTLPDPGRGFTKLTVIDAVGRSATTRFALD